MATVLQHPRGLMPHLFRFPHARTAALAASALALVGAALGVSAWGRTEAAPLPAAAGASAPLAKAMAQRVLLRGKWAPEGPLAAEAAEVPAPASIADALLDAGSAGPAKPFILKARSEAEYERAVRCLAIAIYHEAALEPELGQRAVAQVVLNRVRDPNFPKSVCGVVYEGWERTTGCQFSFTCDGALLRGQIPLLYARAKDYARDALNGHVVPEVGSATHYHADYVSPYWGPTLVRISQIGRHIFYRWPGGAGLPSALTGRYQGGELALSEAVLTGRAARPTPPSALTGEPLVGEGLLIQTVLTADPEQPGVLTERVRGVIAPGGRRLPTAEDIAAINARLEQFEHGGSAPEADAVAASGEDAAAADAAPVVEVNKPAPAAPVRRRGSAPIPSLP